MGLFDFVKKGAQEMFIARPDEAKDLLVYKWPDPTIPMKAQLTVGQDECALFYKDGKFVGRARRRAAHARDAEHPVPARCLMDTFTGGNVLMAEVWFIMLRAKSAACSSAAASATWKNPKSGMAMRHDGPRRLLDPGRRSDEGDRLLRSAQLVHRRGIYRLVQESAAQGHPRSHRRDDGEAERSVAQRRPRARSPKRSKAGRDRGCGQARRRLRHEGRAARQLRHRHQGRG